MREANGSRAATPRVPALERGFHVLRSLARSGPATLADVVEATELNKSTAYYILRTLVDLDAVRYDEAARCYSLGPTLIDLGNAAGRQFDIAAEARRHLLGLVPRLEATIVIYRRVGVGEVVIADRLERDRGVRITVEPGAHLPIQGGSFGRAFLAFDPPDRLADALADGLVRFTHRSTTSVAEFERDLGLVRRQGWAVDHEGFALGVSTVAAPIFDVDGSVRLVAAAVGFTSVLTDEVTREYGQLLRTACDHTGRPFAPEPAAS
ncbi:IclR family transcriptional regulator [Nocardioides sp.]|uniref:IclR family transcriptional regulator n=1 Tax=Nocardioides sp. TaxID=35761 RepID=UPI0039E72310